jgi:formylmethanofuran dehydrogenase subunit D
MEKAVPVIHLNLVNYESIYVSLAAQRDGWGAAYQKNAATVKISPADVERLQIKGGDCVEITSESGSVVVVAESDKDCEEGTGYMPLSLYSNRLAGYDPSRSLLPNLKLIEARASSTKKGVTPISDLLIRRTGAQERPTAAADL